MFILFKVEGNGNCLFSAIKKSLQVCHSGVAGFKDGDRDLPYYPTRYFHHQVMNWMVENRQKVFVYMDSESTESCLWCHRSDCIPGRSLQLQRLPPQAAEEGVLG